MKGGFSITQMITSLTIVAKDYEIKYHEGQVEGMNYKAALTTAQQQELLKKELDVAKYTSYIHDLDWGKYERTKVFKAAVVENIVKAVLQRSNYRFDIQEYLDKGLRKDGM